MGMDLTPVYADTLDAVPGVVTIDATMVSNLGVRTQTALRGPLPRRITTVGYVGYDEDSIQQVATRVDGWIEKLAVRSVGEPVRRGQMLFELYSPTLVNAQQEYLAVLSSSNSPGSEFSSISALRPSTSQDAWGSSTSAITQTSARSAIAMIELDGET